MPPKCFDCNVYKEANVNIAIRSWENYNLASSEYPAFHQGLLYTMDHPDLTVSYFMGTSTGPKGVKGVSTVE